ncbi:MAG: DUF1365 family protein [Parvibaculaceae bacterium]
MESCLYRGYVDHARTRPKRHKLRYRVFSLLLDLDELDAVDAQSRVLGINRRAPLSFRESDHGDGRVRGLKGWVEDHLKKAGLAVEGLRVRVLCYPRIFGYVFNPLTVYYCYDADGAMIATLHEVHNTFDEKHTYVLPAEVGANGTVRQQAEKRMYVSPFTGMDGQYRFDLVPPGEGVRVFIGLSDEDGPLLSASFEGTRQKLTGRALLATFVQYPLMTLKVVAGIHYEALKLWAKRVPLFRHQDAAERISSSVQPEKPPRPAAD